MSLLRYSILQVLMALCVVVCSGVSSQAELAASKLRITGDGEISTIEIEFDGDPLIEPRLLSSPARLILDMQQTFFAIGDVEPPVGSLVASFRTGLMQEGRSRVVIALNGPIRFDAPSLSSSADGKTKKFSIILKKSSEIDFAKSIEEQLLTTASTAGGKSDRLLPNSNEENSFTLVIDAGHGGIDGGALGQGGTIEKEITLKFAKELQAHLSRNASMKVFLTRSDDRFIGLDERVKTARQIGADLFISIHADTIADKSLRGATVYTLSEKASDEVSRLVAQQENFSDVIGGVDIAIEDKTVADILIDLTRRETIQHSVGFARSAVEALQKKTNLIHNPHRSAGFRVLRAADIPSVLVELGYLSNTEDEKQINDTAWRKAIVEELAQAIIRHAETWQIARQ